MDDQTAYAISADPTLCEAEPIHIPAAIQPHGALIAIDPQTRRILHAGGNTQRFWAAAPAELLGEKLTEMLAAGTQARLNDLLALGPKLARPLHAFSLVDQADGSTTDVMAHHNGGLLIFESETRAGPEHEDALALVQNMVRNVQLGTVSQGFCDAITAELRATTGFDRVMLYKFKADCSGLVIAESCAPGVPGYVGQHFPQSDIPAQARALYLQNWIRMIPEAQFAPAPVLPGHRRSNGDPLDLSQSVLRAISPVHQQYLANMGVAASMSLSIIVRGKLWGLIACHHLAPRHLPQRLRMAFELFTEMISSLNEIRVAEQELAARVHANRLHQQVVVQLSEAVELDRGLLRAQQHLLDMVPAGGVALWIEGQFIPIGTTPRTEQVTALVAWLGDTQEEGVFHTECLAAAYPPAADFARTGAGVLALSISRTPRDYVIWFRPEVPRELIWGGEPGKAIVSSPEGARLTPRASFAAWRQAVRLHCEPWQDVEIEAARLLRISLLEVVLRRIDQFARERELARSRQELLLQELDRRVTQWRTAAQALKQESQRRAQAESELSHVLRHTVEMQEAERIRIARELHDVLGQSLTSLQLGLDALLQKQPSGPAAVKNLVTLRQITVEAGREINRLAWEIRPTALDDCGLQTAIRNMLESWSERHSLPVDLHLTLDDRRLSPELETALYRVLQEALTNVVRHAGASRAGVFLGITEGNVTMVIDDDGVGMGSADASMPGAGPGAGPKGAGPGAGPGAGTSKRLGLLGIRERLSLVGGSLEIETVPAKGTTLFVRVPV